MAECGINWHTHDPGVVLTHLAVAIADGADCLADIAALKEQEELFGPVASVATAWRAVHSTASVELRAIPIAVAAARERVWAAEPPQGSMIWDFDSTLLNVHSEKEDAAPTYKHSFGFNPLDVWCDNTDEPLGAMLRSGNAGPNDTDDHLEFLEVAVCTVPIVYRLGHEEGDDSALVVHPILVRADSAGATHRFVHSLSDANFDYSIGFPISGSVHNALLLAQEEDWVHALGRGAQALGPGRPSAPWGGAKAVGSKDVGDASLRDAGAELPQLADDSQVAPARVLSGEAQARLDGLVR